MGVANVHHVRNRRVAFAVIIALGTVMSAAGPAAAEEPTCNWGELTHSAISGGFDQGAHASSEPNPRAGLANVFGQGDLNATCEFIANYDPEAS
jgi:hypothetical protein